MLVDQLKTNNIKFIKSCEIKPSEKIQAPVRNLLNRLKPGVPQVVAYNNNICSIILRSPISMSI